MEQFPKYVSAIGNALHLDKSLRAIQDSVLMQSFPRGQRRGSQRTSRSPVAEVEETAVVERFFFVGADKFQSATVPVPNHRIKVARGWMKMG